MKQKLFLLLFLAGLFQSRPQAQNSLYFMDNLPQRMYSNPALIPKVKFYFNLPFISHLQSDIYNSGFNLNQLNEFSDLLGNPNYDPNEFIKTIGEQNSGSVETRINFLDFGFSLNDKGFLSFSLSQRNYFGINAPSDIMYLLNDYDQIKDRLPLVIEGMNVRLNTFSQLAVIFSHRINKAITLGVSSKLTGGIIGLQSDHLNARLTYDIVPDEYEDYYKSNEHFSGEAMIGLPIPVKRTAINSKGEFDTNESILPDDWTFNFSKIFGNPGFAFDAGVNYDINNRWTFSASLLDIGHTSWEKNGYQFAFQDTVYKITQDVPFKMDIPLKLYLAGSYNFTPQWNTGLVVRNIFHDHATYTSSTLSLNGYVFRMLSTSVSYTKAHSFNTFGGGIRLRFFPGTDIYAVTDNLSQILNIREARHINFAFGLNMAYGLKREKIVKSELTSKKHPAQDDKNILRNNIKKVI